MLSRCRDRATCEPLDEECRAKVQNSAFFHTPGPGRLRHEASQDDDLSRRVQTRHPLLVACTVWSQSTNVTDRQTDGRTDGRHAGLAV